MLIRIQIVNVLLITSYKLPSIKCIFLHAMLSYVFEEMQHIIIDRMFRTSWSSYYHLETLLLVFQLDYLVMYTSL